MVLEGRRQAAATSFNHATRYPLASRCVRTTNAARRLAIQNRHFAHAEQLNGATKVKHLERHGIQVRTAAARKA